VSVRNLTAPSANTTFTLPECIELGPSYEA